MAECNAPEISERRPECMEELLRITVRKKASDLHLTHGEPPVFRIRGDLMPMSCGPLHTDEIERMLHEVTSPRHQSVLKERRSVDFAVSHPDVGRFRFAAFYQRGALSVAIRLLAAGMPDFESLGLPKCIARVASFRDGLVLVTGVTGSGKSTTLATVIDLINRTERKNIITVEDPIEYVHQNRNCIIHQRELHTDVPSFADALRDSLRADPDVILVGEVRDLETMRTAIMAAETGHLVFSTLHSKDALSSVNRMVGAFPAGEQPQVRQQLASTLRAVISQRLLPNAAQTGRVPAVEIMFCTSGIANLIRQAKDDMIYSAIETGGQDDMQTMEQSLINLADLAKISTETALAAAKNKALMQKRLAARGILGQGFPGNGDFAGAGRRQ
ncbi:MAG: PilT/PilU family type 4a pilus ATPase, partial [Syntrophobacteraceae bacterium]